MAGVNLQQPLFITFSVYVEEPSEHNASMDTLHIFPSQTSRQLLHRNKPNRQWYPNLHTLSINALHRKTAHNPYPLLDHPLARALSELDDN